MVTVAETATTGSDGIGKGHGKSREKAEEGEVTMSGVQYGEMVAEIDDLRYEHEELLNELRETTEDLNRVGSHAGQLDMTLMAKNQQGDPTTCNLSVVTSAVESSLTSAMSEWKALVVQMAAEQRAEINRNDKERAKRMHDWEEKMH